MDKCNHPSGTEHTRSFPATRDTPAEVVVKVVCNECGAVLDWTDARDLGMVVKDEDGRSVTYE